MTLLDERDLGTLLARFRRSAFRFEVRDRYDSDIGRESFRRFLAGEPDDYAWHRSWMEMLRRDRQRGKVWQRVRIVSVPLSDWTRYALVVARLSIEAGDDIRYLRRDLAERLGLHPLDSWLLDDEHLVHLRFHDDHTFAGAEHIVDEAVVGQHRAWRDLAWNHARTLEDFVATAS